MQYSTKGHDYIPVRRPFYLGRAPVRSSVYSPAFATSIHKSQGSENRHAIVVIGENGREVFLAEWHLARLAQALRQGVGQLPELDAAGTVIAMRGRGVFQTPARLSNGLPEVV